VATEGVRVRVPPRDNNEYRLYCGQCQESFSRVYNVTRATPVSTACPDGHRTTAVLLPGGDPQTPFQPVDYYWDIKCPECGCALEGGRCWNEQCSETEP
jgi:hypothetical protein